MELNILLSHWSGMFVSQLPEYLKIMHITAISIDFQLVHGNNNIFIPKCICVCVVCRVWYYTYTPCNLQNFVAVSTSVYCTIDKKTYQITKIGYCQSCLHVGRDLSPFPHWVNGLLWIALRIGDRRLRLPLLHLQKTFKIFMIRHV